MSDITNPPLRRFFNKGRWKSGGEETFCGGDSTLAATEPFRAALPAFLAKNKIETLLDAPCGDFAWMRMVDLGGIRYVGMDLVPDFIETNKTSYAAPNREFVVGDITSDPLPPVQLMMVRACLFHLPYLYIFKFFENFLKSGIPHLLMTTQFPSANRDIERPGLYRALDFCKAPFQLPEPIDRVRDYVDGKSERYMAHWTAQQIRSVIEARNKVQSANDLHTPSSNSVSTTQKSASLDSASDVLLTKISSQLDTLIALQRASLIKPDNVFTFLSDDQEIKFHLPYAYHESLQQRILMTADFYEGALLRQVKDIVNGMSVVDVGANIGNHTIFFSKIAKANSITAFEPQRQVFRMLERNIELNCLNNVSAHNVAIGAREGTAALTSAIRFRNLGTATFREDGEYQLKTLDALNPKVDFIKIDVEGLQLDVLRGAQEVLVSQKPIIWVELRKKFQEFQPTNDFLARFGYNAKSLDANNFIFRVA